MNMRKFFTVFFMSVGFVICGDHMASADASLTTENSPKENASEPFAQQSEMDMVNAILDLPTESETATPVKALAKDLDPSYWAYGVIADLASQGVINIQNDAFRPTKGVTVETFTSWLKKAGIPFKVPTKQKPSELIKKDTVQGMLGLSKKDLSSNYFYGISVKEDVHQLYLKGALEYEINVLYSGADTITRAEAALIIRALQTSK